MSEKINQQETVNGETFYLIYDSLNLCWHVKIDSVELCTYYSQPLNEDEAWDEFWARVDYAHLEIAA